MIATAPSPPVTATSADRLRFLVVDDDPDINRLVQVRLRARRFEVVSATNGEEALAHLDEWQPDVILSDVSMPGVSGLELLAHVRDGDTDTAVVLMTAFGSEQVAIEALRKGANDYLRKPFEPSEFHAVIDRTVSRLLLERQNAELRRQLDEQRRQLEAERAQAGVVQTNLLPEAPPALRGFEVAARCVAAREVGGDFYDWQRLDGGRLRVTLGDVMGKGMAAALLMATTRAALRSAATDSVAEALSALDRALGADLERSSSYVTLFHAQLDLATAEVSFVDAGHGHCFILKSDGSTEALEPRCLPVGIDLTGVWNEGALTLGEGDALVIYSDGLIDARPDLALDHDFLARELNGASGAAEMTQRLLNLAEIEGPRPDDFTALVLYRQRGSASP